MWAGPCSTAPLTALLVTLVKQVLDLLHASFSGGQKVHALLLVMFTRPVFAVVCFSYETEGPGSTIGPIKEMKRSRFSYEVCSVRSS